jgi:hypothetical protein
LLIVGSLQDGMNLDESITMGGGDDFASMKYQMSRRKEVQQERKADRVNELQRRDDERQAAFMASLGVDLSKGISMILLKVFFQ